MTIYLIRRLLLALVTLSVVSVIAFALGKSLPGDPTAVLLGDGGGNREAQQKLRAEFGLDDPAPVQYLNWLQGVVTGDFGRSHATGLTITEEISERLPRTLELGFIALFVSVIFAIPVGIISAVCQDRWPDYVFRTLSLFLVSVPFFWLATLIIAVPSHYWHWSPPLRYVPISEDLVDNFLFFLTPGLLLGLGTIGGSLMRITRTSMLDVIRTDYIRTARAKGLRNSRVVWSHALRNTLIPIVTVVGLNVPIVFAGSVIAETIFNIPGMGSYIIRSLNLRDQVVLQGVTLLFALFVIVTNLVVDSVYAVIDPRVRLA